MIMTSKRIMAAGSSFHKAGSTPTDKRLSNVTEKREIIPDPSFSPDLTYIFSPPQEVEE
jgi:hypothetical protein